MDTTQWARIQNGSYEIDKLFMVRHHELLVRSVLMPRVRLVCLPTDPSIRVYVFVFCR